ncbi:MAG: hypothetical protein JWP91_4338 [Fibrobacteres bacterium]|nr:hypothetical protein [Fibrobacterota bacterium]
MVLIFASLLFVVLCAITFFPGMRLLYAKNPAFVGMVLTLSACFLGVYGALEISRSEERLDRMARAATLMDMTKESLSASRMEARILSQLKPEPGTEADPETAALPAAATAFTPDAKPASGSPKELGELLNNGAVVEQISPQSLKALLACQVTMERELQYMSSTRGRDRKHHLNGYLRELAFAQGVLAAEAEFQRGNIDRSDLSEILQGWTAKKALPQI